MIIKCPICGARDLREFSYLGSAKLLNRPKVTDTKNASNAKDQEAFIDYVFIRENKEGPHGEIWLHEYGCRAYLHAIRNTKTNDFLKIEIASEVK